MNHTTEADQIREPLRTRYAAAATAISSAAGASACSGSPSEAGIIASDVYTINEVGRRATAAVLASLGCGYPTARAEPKSADVVLDLGSGTAFQALDSVGRRFVSAFVRATKPIASGTTP